MKVYVVGGSGFIGRVFCKILSRNNIYFKIIDKNLSLDFSSKTDILDIRNLNLLSKHLKTNSIIVNLAAEHRDDVYPKSLYHEVNVQGAKNICAAAREKNINKIIFTSSVAVYGFAPANTNESGLINPFGDYGKTKWEAEEIYKSWQNEDSKNRTLVIIRPTVVFGESNRGNFYNLLKQIHAGHFVMVGSGKNVKSISYVENVSSFIFYSLGFKPGIHIYNYVDKPDFTMNDLISKIYKTLGNNRKVKLRVPYLIALIIGKLFDVIAIVFRKKFQISAIRIKKFCANSVYASSIANTNFTPPFSLSAAITRTIKYEFLKNKK